MNWCSLCVSKFFKEFNWFSNGSIFSRVFLIAALTWFVSPMYSGCFSFCPQYVYPVHLSILHGLVVELRCPRWWQRPQMSLEAPIGGGSFTTTFLDSRLTSNSLNSPHRMLISSITLSFSESRAVSLFSAGDSYKSDMYAKVFIYTNQKAPKSDKIHNIL